MHHRSSKIQRAARRATAPCAPPAPRAFTLHGEAHQDDYPYLADRDDPRTRACIEAEQCYFETCLAPLTGFQQRLDAELKSRLIENDVSVPETFGGYRYYTRIEAGHQYPLHCRESLTGGTGEQVYLDENQLAGDAAYCDVSVVAIDPAHQRVACAVDRRGDERCEVLVGNMNGGDLRCVAGQAGDGIAWSGDGGQLFYTGIDHNARPDSVWVCDLASLSRRRLYLEADPAFHVSVWLSRSGEWVFIDCAGNSSSETLAVPAGAPFSAPAVVIPRQADVEYMVDHHGDRFLVLTNDTAENFRLLAMPARPGGGPLEELIAARDEVTLEYVDVYRHHWIIGERRAGVRYLSTLNPLSGARTEVPGAGPLAWLDVEDLYDYDAGFVRYGRVTPLSPHAVYDFDPASGRSTLRKRDTPPGYRPADYVCERVEVPVDGVRVPLSILRRRDALPAPAGAPLLLSGYGAYEESLELEFDSDLLSLLDRGVVVAAAHVRGGGDLGPAWHDAGRLSAKDNSFRDFLACAHWLIEQGVTAPGRIAARGASAGGLLAAVAVTRAPQLFASVVLEVPFVDVINTLLDTDLPLTEHDFDEFGNPAVAEEYRWLRAYSPYDNIRPQGYPPMLVSTALHDQRVGYWEALKWAARLRATRTDEHPVLVKIDRTGHLGASGRYQAIRESALVYTFLLDMWGLTTDN